MVSSLDNDTDFNIVNWGFARRYISTTSIYNLPTLRTSDISTSNYSKWFQIFLNHERYDIQQKLSQMIKRFSQK